MNLIIQKKIKVLILGSDDFFTAQSISNLVNNVKYDIKGMVVSDSTLGKSNIFNTILKLLNRSGSNYVLFQIIQKGILPIYLKFLKRMNTSVPSVLLRKKSIPIYKLKEYNRRSFGNLVSQINPDLIISCQFTRIIRPEVLTVPKFGCINIHKAYLPHYRGIAPLFWALKNNEIEIGVTVHMMDEGIDTGSILSQEKIKIDNLDSVFSLSLKCANISASLVEKAVSNLITGKIKPIPQSGKSSYYSWPLKNDVAEFLKGNKSFWHWKDFKNIRCL